MKRPLSGCLLLMLMAIGACSASEHQRITEHKVETAMPESRLSADMTLIHDAGTDAESAAESAQIRYRLRNDSDEDIRVLGWNTPMEQPLSADVFEVRRGGHEVAYQGRLVKRAEPDAQDYLHLAAGESMQVVIDLRQYYDMQQPGTYTVRQVVRSSPDWRRSNDEQAMPSASEVLTIVIEGS